MNHYALVCKFALSSVDVDRDTLADLAPTNQAPVLVYSAAEGDLLINLTGQSASNACNQWISYLCANGLCELNLGHVSLDRYDTAAG